MFGFFMGLISAIGALIGIVAGTWLASIYFMDLAVWLSPYILGHEGIAKAVAFLLIFTIVNRLVAFIFWIVNKVFHLVSIIPFLKSINRLGGALLGFVEGALITGTAIFVIAKFAPDIALITNNLNQSTVAHWLVYSTQFLSNFIP
jgi:uncharacterized membrane protein required for colicin V production